MAAAEGAPPQLATAQEVAIAWLRRAIAAGELRPGDRIGQEAVAADIGVSLIPVREALRILESEGLVTYRPRRGYLVTELDLADFEEIYRLRALIEADAVRRGIHRMGPAELAELEAAADDCVAAAAAEDVAGELAANRRFHFLLFALADSTHQERLIRLLWDATVAYRALYYALPGESTEADRAHRRIIAAARAGDADRLIAELDAHRGRALASIRATRG
jgi:DNA-binding GntR family transcriptional regulator